MHTAYASSLGNIKSFSSSSSKKETTKTDAGWHVAILVAASVGALCRGKIWDSHTCPSALTHNEHRDLLMMEEHGFMK